MLCTYPNVFDLGAPFRERESRNKGMVGNATVFVDGVSRGCDPPLRNIYSSVTTTCVQIFRRRKNDGTLSTRLFFFVRVLYHVRFTKRRRLLGYPTDRITPA